MSKKRENEELNDQENEELEETEEYEEVEYIEEDPAQQQIKKWGGIILGGVTLIVVIIFAFNYFQEANLKEKTEASKKLARVLPVFNQGNYEQALNGVPNNPNGSPVIGLKQIVSDHSGTDAAKTAAFYAGKALLEQGNYSEAQSFFDKATDVESKEVRIGALSGLAACQENNGDWSSAAKNYEKASTLTDFEELKSRLLYFSALAYEKGGDTEAAKENYNKVAEMTLQNKYSEYGGLARAALGRLGTEIDE